MATELDVEKLEISKNLLQMNFMKRTLIARERNATLQANTSTDCLSSIDFAYLMPEGVMKRLSERLMVVSNLPIVRHSVECGRLSKVGLRASFNGFNPYLSALNSNCVPQPQALSSIDAEKQEETVYEVNKSRQLISAFKSKSQGYARHQPRKTKRKRLL